MRLERLIYALVTLTRKFRPYFHAHTIVLFIDQPLKHVLYRPDMSRQIDKWAIELTEFDIKF